METAGHRAGTPWTCRTALLFPGRETWMRGRFPNGEGPMIWFTAALIAGAVATASPAEPTPSNRLRPNVGRSVHELLTADDRHVRGVSPLAQQLLTEGVKRSHTFEAILSALEATDLIVHVEVNAKLPASVAGRLLFGSAPERGPRYLRVQIADDRDEAGSNRLHRSRAAACARSGPGAGSAMRQVVPPSLRAHRAAECAKRLRHRRSAAYRKTSASRTRTIA